MLEKIAKTLTLVTAVALAIMYVWGVVITVVYFVDETSLLRDRLEAGNLDKVWYDRHFTDSVKIYAEELAIGTAFFGFLGLLLFVSWIPILVERRHGGQKSVVVGN